MSATTLKKNARHDHYRSVWIIAGGGLMWCYRCGAWRANRVGKEYGWHKPSGPKGDNPAMRPGYKL